MTWHSCPGLRAVFGAWNWDDSDVTWMAAWYHVSIILDQFVSSLYGFSTACYACLYTLNQFYQLRSVKIPNGAIWRRLRRQGTWNHRGTERCCRHLGMRLSWTESTFHHIRHYPFIADVCSTTRSTWGNFPPKKELLGPKSLAIVKAHRTTGLQWKAAWTADNMQIQPVALQDRTHVSFSCKNTSTLSLTILQILHV